MKYIDYSLYKNLNSQKQDIKWTIYLPVRLGADKTASNSSLLHSATSLLKKTLKQDGIAKKEIQLIISSLKNTYKELSAPLKTNSILAVIKNDFMVELYGLPIKLDSGFISNLPGFFFKPLDEYYSDIPDYYILSLDQKGCQLYKSDTVGLTRVSNPYLEQSLSELLRIDEHNDKSLQIHMTSSGNSGLPEGFHGQGGFKDKQKTYIKQYLMHIDKQLSYYSHKTLRPVIIVGSKPLTSIFAKISRNRRLIKGYTRTLPNKIDKQFLQTIA